MALCSAPKHDAKITSGAAEALVGTLLKILMYQPPTLADKGCRHVRQSRVTCPYVIDEPRDNSDPGNSVRCPTVPSRLGALFVGPSRPVAEPAIPAASTQCTKDTVPVATRDKRFT